MTNPLILAKRELRDFLDFRQFLRNSKSSISNTDDLDALFEFANGQIKPIQKKSEILSLIRYLKNRKPENYCEIGLANGGTCFLITNGVQSIKNVYGIDRHIFNKRLQRHFAGPIRQLEFKTGYSTQTNVINWLAQKLTGKKLDVLFIDGDHSYKGVKSDFINYHHLVSEDGLIVFHDIILDHGQKHGIKTNRNTGGVPTFYQEISPFFESIEFVEDSEQDGFGIGVIHYKAKQAHEFLNKSAT